MAFTTSGQETEWALFLQQPMALDPLNNSNLEQLALKELMMKTMTHFAIISTLTAALAQQISTDICCSMLKSPSYAGLSLTLGC